MTTRKQGQPPNQSQPNQPVQAVQLQNQIQSQVNATFAPLQLPVTTGHLSIQAQNQQTTTPAQSILYRSENNTQYSQARAILWEIQYIISGLVSKKGVAQVTQDLQQLSKHFDYEFDKYLVRELVEQIDLKDPSKPNRDRSEPVKCVLLNQELSRMCGSPNFLLFFDEISKYIFGDGHHKDFHKVLSTRLKLSAKMQLLIALSLFESSLTDDDRLESKFSSDFIDLGAKLVKQKLIEYHTGGAAKAEPIEEYALHRLLHIFRVDPEFDANLEGAQTASQFEAAKKFLVEHNQVKPSQHVALRLSVTDGDLTNFNPTLEDPSNSLLRHGSGLSHLCQVNRLIEPWEVLLDLGQSSSLNYQILALAMQDFKEINEKAMANMLLHLAVYYQGQDDLQTRIVFGIFEANKTGDASKQKNEPSEKQTQTQWHVAHFSRAQRENYAHLKWDKILESFTELPPECLQINEKFDSKAYSFFLQLFNKSKPQNVVVPISLLLEEKWRSPSLQLQFIKNAINAYVTGEDKTFSFAKCTRKIGQIPEFPDTNSLFIDVWSSPEVIQALLNLSETESYHTARQILEQPLINCPEYLLLSLSIAKVEKGNFLFDELFSQLMRGFLESYPQSSPVLKKLWDLNPELFVKGISGFCNENRINSKQNVDKALEIAQGINDSLIRLVKSVDFNFAVNLGVLAGNRDILNYDAWLVERIQTVGSQFVRALTFYLLGQVFRPIQEFLAKNKLTVRSTQQMDQQLQHEVEQIEEQKKIENEISQTLLKAHISKDHLLLTIEYLKQYLNGPNEDQIVLKQNKNVTRLVKFAIETFNQVFPNHSANQHTQEIEKIVNKFFKSVFKADIDVVDQRVAECLQKIHALSQSRHHNERDNEIFTYIVHTFFDEYRFINNFKEKKYLISFAKLFGGMINKTILDDTLLDLFILFVIQTLQNSDQRLTFGIEVLKQCYQYLPDLPTHFKDIYTNYQDKIRDYDPVFHAKFVQVYNQTFQTQSKAGKVTTQETKKAPERQDLLTSTIEDFDNSNDLKKAIQKPSERGDSNLKSNKNESKQSTQIVQKGLQQTKSTPVPINDKRKSPDQSSLPQQKSTKEETFKTQIGVAVEFKPNNQNNFVGISSEIPFSIDSAPFNTTQAVQIPGDQNILATQSLDSKSSFSNINMDAAAFNPNTGTESVIFQPEYTKEQTQTEQEQKWQQNIDRIISEAKKNNRGEIQLAELIEDPCLQPTLPEYQKDIRFICNNTGKETQLQRLEEANKLFAQQDADKTLSWFLHYFLTQRLLNLQAQLPLFIDMFKKFNAKNVVQKCVKTCIDILKRCMLIQEEDYNIIAKRGQASANPVKNYVQWLGTFVGMLTYASSRPIHRCEIDLKQLLVEGFTQKNKLAVLFVCRVIKEATKDRYSIFNRKNPHIRTLLEMLKEGQELNLLNLRQNDDFLHEIQLVLKEFNYTSHGHDSIIPSVIKSHLMLPTQLQYLQQQTEAYQHEKKMNAIPQRARTEKSDSIRDNPQETDQAVDLSHQNEEQLVMDEFNEEIRRFNNQDEIYQYVLVQPVTVEGLQQLFDIPIDEIKRLVSEVIEQAVKEILPPVVQRSVSIALITTRELVLKDFTYDSDIKKVIDAIDSIVKNLAGSLALVTCREPLRLQLTQLLFKELKESCFQYGAKNGLCKGDDLRKENQSPAALQKANEMDQQLKEYITQNDEQILQLCQDLSKDNLELGCKIVKLTVFENAVRRIQQDEEIRQALDKRKHAASFNRPFVDETYVNNFRELPEQLKPNRDGLTPQQLQVYSDFGKLNQQYIRGDFGPLNIPYFQYKGQTQDSKKNQLAPQTPMSQYLNQRLTSLESQQDAYLAQEQKSQSANQQIIEQQATHNFQLAQLLKDLDQKDQKCLSQFMRCVLTLKIQELNKLALSQMDQSQKKNLHDSCTSIWKFVERKFRQLNSITSEAESNYLLEVLALIVTKLKVQDFSLKLLNDVYCNFEPEDIQNVTLTIELISRGILPIKEWEKKFAVFVRDAPGNLIEKNVEFLARFVDNQVIRSLIDTQGADKLFPTLLKITKELEKQSKQDPNSEMLTEQLEFVNGVFNAQNRSKISNYVQLKNLFIKWVDISHVVDQKDQQRCITQFFTEYREVVPIEQDLARLFDFCDVMIRTSIDLTTLNQNGEQIQNNALLNYNFIDGFVRLIFTIMQITEFNKQEFMSKIFDLIKQKLDYDHQLLQKNLQNQSQSSIQAHRFNQKPYYRMMMNILTAVNISDCFNQKAQRQIMFDMANMLRELNPDKYPAFAFAWLEIISHRMFMSHFIKRPDPTQNQGWFIMKDLMVGCFSFLKHNMVLGQQTTAAVDAFYRGTLRVVLLIVKDHGDFVAQFHYSFICSLPDHAIQLRNIILSAYPQSITGTPPDPFKLHLNINLEEEKNPEILSNYEASLSINNLRDDLDAFIQDKQDSMLIKICDKLMSSVERLNGQAVQSSSVINAVILYFLQSNPELQLEEIFYRIMELLDEETRMRFLNATVNELRYPNSHTYHVCLILTKIYSRSNSEIKDQITRILLERLQAHEPHPWGLLIIFREFNQNGELQFSQSDFYKNNKDVIEYLFSNRLKLFRKLMQELLPQQSA